MNKLKYRYFFIVMASIAFYGANIYAMAEQKETTRILTDSPVVVPGKIVFQSNRDGALSEIWVVREGQSRKIISSSKTSEDLPKELPIMFSGALTDLKKPKWSPDGSRILCVVDDGIIIIDETGKILEKVKPALPALNAKWSPNGDIYYTSVDFLPGGGGSANIFKINIKDHTEQRITNLSPTPGVKRILSFSVSPDDKTIALQIWGEEEFGISIWTINTDGTDLKLFVKYAGDPTWSSDGKKLAYVSRNLPSGEKIEFLDIFVLDIASGETVRVTNNKWEEHSPVFSPDGKQIAYSSARHKVISHGAEIFVSNIDGSGETRLTSPQLNPSFPNDSIRGWATDEYPDWAE